MDNNINAQVSTEESLIKVAVYGTLKRGGALHGSVIGSLVSVKNCTFKGSLYNLGWYPGVKLGTDDTVKAELHTFRKSSNIIDRLDAVEGFRSEGNINNLYNREVITVTTEDGMEEEAYVYEYNRAFPKENKIESGEWEV